MLSRAWVSEARQAIPAEGPIRTWLTGRAKAPKDVSFTVRLACVLQRLR